VSNMESLAEAVGGDMLAPEALHENALLANYT
jgi:hypothetical protein